MNCRTTLSVAAVCILTSASLTGHFRLAGAQTAAPVKQAPPVDLSKYAPLTPNAGDGDYVIGPPYANAPELTPRDDVPKGMVYRFTMNSTDSKMYPGISKTAPGT